MKAKAYRTLYYPFSKINPFAVFLKQDGTDYEVPANQTVSCDIPKIFSTIAKYLQEVGAVPPADVFNVDIYTDRLRAELGDYWLPINPRKTSIASLYNGILLGASGINVEGKYYLRLLLPDGTAHKTNISDIFTTQTEAGPIVSHQSKVYSDVAQFLNAFTRIIIDNLSRAKTLADAYNAIPVVNEQFTDESTATPNLKTENADTFDPIMGYATADAKKYTTTQTGTSTTVVKRATGTNAKAQADIVRELPNIFMDCIDEIKTLLVEGDTVQAMIDYGTAFGDYIAEE